MLDLLLPHNGSTLELANIYLASSIVVGIHLHEELGKGFIMYVSV